jgi:hypothetical protein
MIGLYEKMPNPVLERSFSFWTFVSSCDPGNVYFCKGRYVVCNRNSVLISYFMQADVILGEETLTYTLFNDREKFSWLRLRQPNKEKSDPLTLYVLSLNYIL